MEVVKVLQFYCNEQPFGRFLYDLYKWEVLTLCQMLRKDSSYCIFTEKYRYA